MIEKNTAKLKEKLYVTEEDKQEKIDKEVERWIRDPLNYLTLQVSAVRLII